MANIACAHIIHRRRTHFVNTMIKLLSRPFKLLFFSCILFFNSKTLYAVPKTEVVNDPKKLVFIFQKQKNPAKIQETANSVANYLAKEIGIPVKAIVPSGYGASVQAIVSKTADIAYTSSLPFLLARRDGGASMLLAEQRIDNLGVLRTDYDSVFVVKKDSPLKDIKDLEKRAKDLRMAFTSPTSTSGYIFASSRLIELGLAKNAAELPLAFRSAQFAGSYTQALEQVLQGRADICAVSYYAVEGVSATKYLSSKKLKNLRILTRTPGVPTHIVSARSGLSEALKSSISNALLKLSKENPKLLEDVYGTAKFIKVDEDKHVSETVKAVSQVGLPIESLVKKPKADLVKNNLN